MCSSITCESNSFDVMTINLWICVPVQMDFLTTKILVKITYRWFCEDNILVAFVYVRHQPQKERKAELESRFRGEGGSGGWSWSKQSTSWPPVLDLYFLYFCISSPVLDLYFLFFYISFPVLDLYCLYLSISSLVLDMYFNTFVFLFPVLDLYLLVLLHFLFQGQPQNMSHLCDACCLYLYCRLITIRSWLVSFPCYIVSLKISQRNLFVWQLYNIGKRFLLKDVSQKFLSHTTLLVSSRIPIKSKLYSFKVETNWSLS